jgi:NAD(P)-dependent dehydrogenase (short-subunit alcohol dehydrogenase family)
MQVNHLGTTLLALLLLPHMAATPGSPRITIVASEMHYWVRHMDEFKANNVLKKLNDPTGMNTSKMSEKYGITKCAFLSD